MERVVCSWASDRHLRLVLGADASAATPGRVLGAYEALRAAGILHVVDIVPAYATVTIEFDPMWLEPQEALASVSRALAGAPTREQAAGRYVEVPVCYGGEFGADLSDVAARHGLSEREVVELHASVGYRVAFLGFMPGFAYLAGLPERLATPRLETPRVRVPAGSVGIAGDQAGIYPSESPGGWRLLGRTPLRMFDARRMPAALLGAGDRVRLVPITPDRFAELARASGGDA